MKKIYSVFLTLLGLATGAVSAQTIVTKTDFSSWTSGAPTNWKGVKTTFAPDSMAQISGNSAYGSSDIKLVSSTSSHKRLTTKAIAVTAGKTYQATYWVRGNGQVRFGLFDNDLSNNDAGYTYASYTVVNSASNTAITQVVTADTTYASAEFILSVKSTVGPDHLQVDSIVIIEGAAPELTIHDIQYTSLSNGDSPYNNQKVGTAGVITGYEFGSGTAVKGFWMQSGVGAYNGIFVEDSIHTTIAKGDSVYVQAKVKENFSCTHLLQPDSFAVRANGVTLPAPFELSTALANTEAYEGVLVKVVGARATKLVNQYGEWPVVQAGNDTLVIDDYIYWVGTSYVVVGDNYDITGLMDYSYSKFRLNPRSSFDIVKTTGVNELNSSLVRVAPNPAHTFIVVSLIGSVTESAFQVLDVTGKVVLNGPLKANKTTLNLEHLNAGIYFISVNQNGTLLSKKFIKE